MLQDKPILKAHLLLIMMALIGDANYIIAKNIVPVFIGPSGLIVIRAFSGALFFMLVSPIVITLFAIFILKDKVSWLNGFGMFLGVSGALMLILSKKDLSSNQGNSLGDLFIFINAISWGIYTLLQKVIHKYHLT